MKVVNTTDPKVTERNRKKIQEFNKRVSKFFYPITKHFRNTIEFISEDISKMPEMENLPKGNSKDFTSKVSYALSLGMQEKEIFLFGLNKNLMNR
mgnify:FL=1